MVVPVSAGLLIIALVFLPLVSLEGLEGKLFAPVALTIIFALVGSLVLALTLVPVLASFTVNARLSANGASLTGVTLRVTVPVTWLLSSP